MQHPIRVNHRTWKWPDSHVFSIPCHWCEPYNKRRNNRSWCLVCELEPVLHFPAQVKAQESTLFCWRVFFPHMAECLHRTDAQTPFEGSEKQKKKWHLCQCHQDQWLQDIEGSRSRPWFPMKYLMTGCSQRVSHRLCSSGGWDQPASASALSDPDELFVPWRILTTTWLVQRGLFFSALIAAFKH